MSDIEYVNNSFLYDIEHPEYYKYEKLEFSKIVGMRITGAIWSRWDAFICLKAPAGKRYVLYIFQSGLTGEPGFRIFDVSSGLSCFKLPMCWNKRSFKKWVKVVEQKVQDDKE